MKYICYAAYSNDFVDLAKNVFKKLGKNDVDVQLWDQNNPQKFIQQGFKVLMARGGTAIRIKKALDIPVVEIPVPLEDMIAALVEASKLGKNVAVIGYNNLTRGLDLLNPILNINIKQITAEDSADTRLKIERLKEENIDVIVGGLLQTYIAKELNLTCVRINLTEKALIYAYNECKNILNSLLSEARKTEELKTILNTTNEGYVAIDNSSKITLINNRALKMIPKLCDEPIGEEINKAVPELNELVNVFESGIEKTQETITIGKNQVLCDMIPIKLDNNKIIGAIATFNDINTITKGEHKIRTAILDKGLYATYNFDDILGVSDEIKKSIEIAKNFSLADSTVLIVGNTGVGKELFAQSIHNESNRKSGPFIAVNCASLPESILESELFGYEEGAFTGAKKSGKPGLFELAHKGTIFLDEISEIPLVLQGRLLRVIQERKVMRLGSDRVIPIDVRIIAATNKKLAELVSINKFREDLFYRLNVLTLAIPPLCERKDDIDYLSKAFLNNFNKSEKIVLTDEAIRALRLYNWPGNIRQLQNFIEKVCIICRDKVLDFDVVYNMIKEYEPRFMHEDGNNNDADNLACIHKSVTLEDVEKALSSSGGNKNEAAKLLGIHRSTLWRILKNNK